MSSRVGARAGSAALALLAAALTAGGCGDRKAAPAVAVAAASSVTAPAPASASTATHAAATSVAPSGQADRLPPPEVPPVERNGIVYTQAPSGHEVGVDQVGGVLVATEAGSGKRLWTLAVYPNPIDAAQEADAQWIFFRSMAFEPDGRLRIVNEAGKAYRVDVGTRQVTPAP